MPRPMKVKGLDANLGGWFGGGFCHGWMPEGRRSPCVVSVSVASWSAGVILALFWVRGVDTGGCRHLGMEPCER